MSGAALMTVGELERLYCAESAGQDYHVYRQLLLMADQLNT